MERKLTRRLASVGVLVAAIGAAGAIAAAPAMAAQDPGTNLGHLHFSPSTGTGSTNFNMVSDGPCPSGATNIVAFINSTANGWADVVLLGNTTNGVSTTGPMSVGVSNNLFNTAQANTLTLGPGQYDIFLRCQGRLGTPNFGSYGGSLTVGAAPGGDTSQAPYSEVVVKTNTTTSNVTANPTSASSGAAIALSAAVAGVSGSAVPTGEVDFFDGATKIGQANLDGAGNASTSVSTLSIGSHTITATYLGDSSFNGSQSPNGTTVTIGAGVPVLTVKVNGSPVTSPASATSTDTVLLSASVGASGSCEFFDSASSLGTSTASGGVCTKSLGSLPAKDYSFTVAFTPTGSSTVTSAAFALHVSAATTGGSVTENINVSVPAGSLTISLDTGQDGEVNLSTPALRAEGDYLTSSGAIDPVKVVDTRTGTATGWDARGVVTDFQGKDVGNTGKLIKAENLGWTPLAALSKSASQTITPGPVVAPSTPPLDQTAASTGAGLASSRLLASAAAGAARGTAVLVANLALNVPTTTVSGAYTAQMTLTVA